VSFFSNAIGLSTLQLFTQYNNNNIFSFNLFFSVLSRLEKLKTEATQIGKKVEETDKTMLEINSVFDLYRPLAQACSNIYFTMESLSQVKNFLLLSCNVIVASF
jgi:hypothetical protein